MTISAEDIFYIFIEDHNEKCVIRFVQDFDWKVIAVAGSLPDDVELYSNKYDIDDIMDDLRGKYDYVEEIELKDVDDYMS